MASVRAHRSPGCVFGIFCLAVVVAAGALVPRLLGSFWRSWIGIVAVVVVGLVLAGLLYGVYRLMYTGSVEVCPHCGAEADPNFPVCQVCGRQK